MDELVTSDFEATLRRIMDKLIPGYAPQKVILYGSWAWGLPHLDSDLDLLIVKDTPLRPLERCAEVRRIINDRSGKVPIDLFVMTPDEVEDRLKLGDPFIKMIVQQGTEIYDCATGESSIGDTLQEMRGALVDRMKNAKTAAYIEPMLQGIMKKLIAGYAPDKVVLFGSWANDYAQEDSSVDLLIVKETDDRYLDRCFKVRRAITDPLRTIPVDVFVFTPAELAAQLKKSDSFLREAWDKGKILYAA